MIASDSKAQSSDGICPESIMAVSAENFTYSFNIPGVDQGTVVNWNFGDETEILDDDSVMHSFEMGVYLVVATFMDADCPWDGPTVLQLEVVADECFLSLSYVEGKNGLFTVTAEGYPKKYPMYWDMGDGTTIVETWVVDHIFEPGTYEVCSYIVSDFCADTLSACIEIVYDPLALEFELTRSSGISIFPNPSHEQLQIVSDEILSEILILDSAGRCLMQLRPSAYKVEILNDHIAPGFYFLEFICGDKKLMKRFIVE